MFLHVHAREHHHHHHLTQELQLKQQIVEISAELEEQRAQTGRALCELEQEKESHELDTEKLQQSVNECEL